MTVLLISAWRKERATKVALGGAILLFSVALAGYVVTQIITLYATRAGLHYAETGRYVHCDFISFYMAGKMIGTADRLRIFDPAVQLSWQNLLISPDKIRACIYLPQIPFFFLIMWPFAWLPLKPAFAIWMTMSLVASFAGLFLLSRGKTLERASIAGMIVVGTIASTAGLKCLLVGQSSWWLLALVCFFYWSFSQKRDIACGIAAGVAAIKPHFLLFMLIPVALSGRKKLLAATAAALAVVLLGPGFIVGWTNVFCYPAFLLHYETTREFDMLFPERMVSIRGLLTLALPPAAALAAAFAAFALALALCSFIWHRCLKKQTISAAWAMAVSLVLLLVASPHTHVYDLILLALPAALTLPTWRAGEILALAPPSLKLWCLTLLLYPLLSWLAFLLLPTLACLILPEQAQLALSANDFRCGVLAYDGLFFLNTLLLACGAVYLLKRSAPV